MSAWYRGRLLAFDCETTGVDVENARIVTCCMAMVGGEKPSEVRTWLADPGVDIPAGATEIHRITTEQAQREGRPAEEVISEALETLRSADYGVLVGYNCRFDISLLDREARRYGVLEADDLVADLSIHRLKPLWVVDPLVLDKWLDRFRPGSRRLPATCEAYGIRLGEDDAHSADADALAAARLAWVMGRRGEVKRRVRGADEGRELARLKREWEAVRHDPDLLHGFQVVLAAEQAAGLEEYLRAGDPKKGTAPDPAAVVERDWPLIPTPVRG